MRIFVAPALVLLSAALAVANDPPAVDHQPALCTVPDKPLSLCAAVSDDGNVAVARIYFRREGEVYYSFVQMAFTGVSYCGTLPAPRERAKAIEYYVQAVDDQYETFRTSTHVIAVQPDVVCGFAPVEKDASRAQAITVHATHPKQGRKLPDAFVSAGVTFVPVQGH